MQTGAGGQGTSSSKSSADRRTLVGSHPPQQTPKSRIGASKDSLEEGDRRRFARTFRKGTLACTRCAALSCFAQILYCTLKTKILVLWATHSCRALRNPAPSNSEATCFSHGHGRGRTIADAGFTCILYPTVQLLLRLSAIFRAAESP